MGNSIEPAFVIRTFRISAGADQQLNSASLALGTPKSRLIEEAIPLVVKMKRKSIQRGAQQVRRNLDASLAR